VLGRTAAREQATFSLVNAFTNGRDVKGATGKNALSVNLAHLLSSISGDYLACAATVGDILVPQQDQRRNTQQVSAPVPPSLV